jgi:hypothetical protein
MSIRHAPEYARRELVCDLCRRVLPHRALSSSVLLKAGQAAGWRRQEDEGQPPLHICPACLLATKMPKAGRK